jgi:tRNA A-37 threonylcarbamoyl transferase component Bud32
MTVSLIGKRFGNYDIQAKLGEGGMGMVYLGIHPQIGKRVAIKVLHEDLASKADVVNRFFNEAKSVNDINHPNIVDIVDFGEIAFDGVTFKYIIMEFLDGEALAVRIRREGVSIRETIYIIGQCASALAASHGKGVVHRDLKPENIYLCSRGPDRNYVKILDFGIAKLTGDGNAISQKTRTGMVIGTPAYMSPEQCEGKGNIDHRSDIYALGVVMYELLTGRVPFPGEGFGEVLVAHLTREPDPPSQANINIPAEIEAIVMRCLRKDKSQRFQSMAALSAALSDPVSHYNQWMQTAQLPPGAMVASAGMGTILLGDPNAPAPPPGSGSWNPAASGLVQLPPDMVPGPPRRTGMAMMPGGNPSLLTGANPSMRTGAGQALPSGAHPAMTGANQAMASGAVNLLSGGVPAFPGQSQSLGLPADMLVPGVNQGRRPTTLSGASGEAGTGRRPLNVLAGFVGAIAVGVFAMVGIKVMKGPGPEGGGPTTQQREGQTVSISVRSNPPQAEVMRSDRLEANPEKTPYRFQVKKGSPAVDVKLRLAGYTEQTRTVSTDKDQTIEVTLSRLPGPAVAEKGRPDKGKPIADSKPTEAEKPSPPDKPAPPAADDEDTEKPEKTARAAKPAHEHHHHPRKDKDKDKDKGGNEGALPLSF